MLPSNLLKEPYQYYADSPTIKQYTLWHLYDYYLDKLVKNKIQIGGSSRLLSGDYNLLYDGTTVKRNLIEIHVSRPLGIISPLRDKLAKIHYYLIKDEAYSIKLGNGKYRIAFTAPRHESIIPQHLIIDVHGRTSIEINMDYAGTKSFRSVFLEIHLNNSSKLDLAVYITDSDNAPSNINIGIKQGKYASLNMTYLVVAGKMTRLIATNLLDGEYSESNIRGIVFVDKRNRIDNITNILSRNTDTYSNFLFTALVNNEGLVAQRGVGKIISSAGGSGIEYYSEALLLTETAKAYLQPRLEIDTGDVIIAKHAARNIHVLYDQIYYLQTRGINSDQARSLVITGYLTKNLPSKIHRSKIISTVKTILSSIIT